MEKKTANASHTWVKWLPAIVVGVVVLAVVMACIRWWQVTRNLMSFRVDDQGSLESSQSLPTHFTKSQMIVKRIRELMVIDDQAEPKLLVLKNVETLKKAQPNFYAAASDGDILAVFSTQLVVYSESQDKIVATQRLEQVQLDGSPTVSPSLSPQISTVPSETPKRSPVAQPSPSPSVVP